MRAFHSLSGRLLVLTIVFVMLAETLIFVPSVARFRVEYLRERIDRADLAVHLLQMGGEIPWWLERDALRDIDALSISLVEDGARVPVMAAPLPLPIAAEFEIEAESWPKQIADSLTRLAVGTQELIRVVGRPTPNHGHLIEITVDSQPMRTAMIVYGLRILVLSLVISGITAALLFLAIRRIMVDPVKGLVRHMKNFADNPEDARRVIEPQSRTVEIREAENALLGLETELTRALKRKGRLAQLGTAVARVSHDLRNILTSTQLFADRLESAEDPLARRLAHKIVGSVTRGISLCESTLAFGRAEEPPPTLTIFCLETMTRDLVEFESERQANEGGLAALFVEMPAKLMMRADPDQIFRMVLNLVRNSMEAVNSTGEPGKVVVRAREEESAWYIEIADTGPGLPEKALNKLFLPFQGGVRAGGSGLGLAIAAEIARGHGGRLQLKETGEGGTVFEARIPKDDGTVLHDEGHAGQASLFGDSEGEVSGERSPTSPEATDSRRAPQFARRATAAGA